MSFLFELTNLTGERSKDWFKVPQHESLNDAHLLYLSNELGGESGELQNKVKKLVRENWGMQGSRTTLEEVKAEMADVIICVANIAAALQIDLQEEVVKKFNKTSEDNGFPQMF